MSDSKKDFYMNAYSGKAMNSWTGNPDRYAIVQEWATACVYWAFDLPLRCLDIGCGNGVHTAWIGNQYSGKGSWTGIDIIDAETMGLVIPFLGRFAVADLRTADGWNHPYLQEKYTLIVDQGAIFIAIDSDEERDIYLQHITDSLQTNGIFLGLVMYGAWGPWEFPDGRMRFKMTEADVVARCDEWLQRFGLRVLDVVVHTYPPDHPNGRVFPYEVSLMHIVFQKI